MVSMVEGAAAHVYNKTNECNRIIIRKESDMKLDKETLMQIIKEELEDVLDESALLKRHMKDRKQKFLKKLKDMGKPARKTFNSLDPQMRSVFGSIACGWLSWIIW